MRPITYVCIDNRLQLREWNPAGERGLPVSPEPAEWRHGHVRALCIHRLGSILTRRSNNIIVGVSYAISVCGYGQTGIGLTDGVFANNVVYATDSNSNVGVRAH